MSEAVRGVLGWVEPRSRGRKLRLSHQLRSETDPFHSSRPLLEVLVVYHGQNLHPGRRFLRFPLSLQLTNFFATPYRGNRCCGRTTDHGPRLALAQWRASRSVHPPSNACGTQSAKIWTPVPRSILRFSASPDRGSSQTDGGREVAARWS